MVRVPDRTDPLTAGLDPTQVEAVRAEAAPLAVIAAAGAGKTSVLTRRIARRVRSEEVEERHVVALTFSRQAASELTNRLARLEVRGVTVGTFHAVAYGVLRQRWTDQGRPAPGLVVNRTRLLVEAAGGVDASRRRLDPNELGGELDWARAQLIPADRYARAAKDAGRRTAAPFTAIAEAMAGFETLKRRRRVIDFDDLLDLSVRELQDPVFAAQVQWRFRHFFVDEFQDVNPLQFAVLEAWRADRPDLCVVGDPRQAIYGWNGADPGLLLRVEETYPGVQIIRLRRNYRCVPTVVSAAAAVLHTGDQFDDAVPVRAEPGSLELVEALDPSAEADVIVDRLRRLRPPGSRWSSMAVLARTNHQLEPIRAAFARAGVPAQLATRPQTADDDPSRRALLADARQCTGSDELANWGRDLDDGLERASPLHRRLATAVRTYLAGVPNGTGSSFVEWFDLTGGGDEPIEARDAVALLTFHAAKGREWRTVAVAGVEAGLVPHAGAIRPEARAEEIRLLYVALTRASDHLVVTWCIERDGRTARPSPLLEAITALEAPPDSLPDLPQRHTTPAPPPDPVLEALTRWRERAAVAAALPPVAICDDDTLRAVAHHRPTTLDELADVPGVSRMAAVRLGPRLLAVLAGV